MSVIVRSVLAIAALLTGCTTTLTPGGALVKETDVATFNTERCDYLGFVTGHSSYNQGSIFETKGRENAKNDARNKAAEMGATDITDREAGFGRHMNIRYKAYSCK